MKIAVFWDLTLCRQVKEFRGNLNMIVTDLFEKFILFHQTTKNYIPEDGILPFLITFYTHKHYMNREPSIMQTESQRLSERNCSFMHNMIEHV
jgi:hypothetical protein